VGAGGDAPTPTGRHLDIGLRSRNKPPLGPSGGSVASQRRVSAACSGLRGARSVRTQPGHIALAFTPHGPALPAGRRRGADARVAFHEARQHGEEARVLFEPRGGALEGHVQPQEAPRQVPVRDDRVAEKGLGHAPAGDLHRGLGEQNRFGVRHAEARRYQALLGVPGRVDLARVDDAEAAHRHRVARPR
jgi:hypothetical protein